MAKGIKEKTKGLIVVTLRPSQVLDKRVNNALTQLQKTTPGTWPFYFAQHSPYGEPVNLIIKRKNLAFALNQARKIFLRDSFDYFVHIESDTIVPDFAIIEMMETGSDIATGLQRLKYPPYYLSCHKQNPAWDEIAPMQLTEDDLNQRFLPVDWYSLGCILIKRYVLEEIEFEPGINYGVDWVFAEKCHKKGFRCILCTRIKCGHILKNGRVVEV